MPLREILAEREQELLENLGKPKKGFKWINTKLGCRGIPIGEFIQVPEQIIIFSEIKEKIKDDIYKK